MPPFEEGYKQTNDETGVEYIFSDGGWRPLGPKIEDQFDELDDRYLVKTGDSYTGYLDFKGNPSGARFFRDDVKLFSIWDFGDPYTLTYPRGVSTCATLLASTSCTLLVCCLGLRMGEVTLLARGKPRADPPNHQATGPLKMVEVPLGRFTL